MKYSFITIVMFLTMISASYAEERQTLIGHGFSNGGMGGFTMKATRINGEYNLLLGGKGAWLIDNRLYFGGGGSGITMPLKGTNDEYEGGMGGIMFGYLFNPNSLFHFGTELMIGAGAIAVSQREMMDEQHHDHDGDAFFYAEPSVYMAMNIAPHFKVHTGLSYRYINGSNTEGLSDDKLRGLSIEVSFLFGKF